MITLCDDFLFLFVNKGSENNLTSNQTRSLKVTYFKNFHGQSIYEFKFNEVTDVEFESDRNFYEFILQVYHFEFMK